MIPRLEVLLTDIGTSTLRVPGAALAFPTVAVTVWAAAEEGPRMEVIKHSAKMTINREASEERLVCRCLYDLAITPFVMLVSLRRTSVNNVCPSRYLPRIDLAFMSLFIAHA